MTEYNNAYEFLVATKKLIEKPENWCREEYARSRHGSRRYATSVDACAWCSQGAMFRINGGSWLHRNPVAYQAERLLERAMGRGIIGFNDEHTHEEVMAAFDVAIAEAKKEFENAV